MNTRTVYLRASTKLGTTQAARLTRNNPKSEYTRAPRDVPLSLGLKYGRNRSGSGDLRGVYVSVRVATTVHVPSPRPENSSGFDGVQST